MPHPPPSPAAPPAPGVARLVLWGLASLAAAMGIGRFAFTPLMPLMQQHDGLTLAQGAALAAANYLGYFLGALACFALVPRPAPAIRLGLLAVALSTLAMALPLNLPTALLLRGVAGVASAFVLVGVSGRALTALAAAGRGDLTGWVFAGVGTGIVLAGVLAMGVALAGAPTPLAWGLLGAAAALVCALGWRTWAEPGAAATSATSAVSTTSATSAVSTISPVSAISPTSAPAAGAPDHGPGAAARGLRLDAAQRALVLAYGSFGLGYIIPATFLPAMARNLVADPLVFGWAWPVFGLAAAVSTVVVTRALGGFTPRQIFTASVLLMAAGVLLPALSGSMVAIVLGALAVGGTFMVATMAGLQEARRMAQGRGQANPQRLMAAMTAAFALGQLLGPLLVAAWSRSAHPILAPSALAASVLVGSAALLVLAQRRSRPIPRTTETPP